MMIHELAMASSLFVLPVGAIQQVINAMQEVVDADQQLQVWQVLLVGLLFVVLQRGEKVLIFLLEEA